MYYRWRSILCVQFALVVFCGALNANYCRANDYAKNSECTGCHSVQRSQPKGGKLANGFGQWSDLQCYGCHAEITDVARNWAAGKTDDRFYALPVSDASLKRISTHGMAYLTTPENWHLHRYDHMRLQLFLAQPVRINPLQESRFPLMVANGEFLKSDTLLPKINKAKAQAGGAIFAAKCMSCHGDITPVSGRSRLSLFAFDEKWLYRYANKMDAGFHASQKPRVMPLVSLTHAEANSVYEYLGDSYIHQKEELRAAVDRIVAPSAPSKSISAAQVDYIWTSFFRDAACVHCHAIEGRAKMKFDLSNNMTLGVWLSTNDPYKLWRRLEIRELENRYGIGFSEPGMPMTGAPLPESFRKLIYHWISSGCLDQYQKINCPAR